MKDRGGAKSPACVPMGLLPPEMLLEAAATAREHNPTNDVAGHLLGLVRAEVPLEPQHLAMLVQKKWAPGTTIPVAFLDNPPPELRAAILAHANAWHDLGVNCRFAETRRPADALVRVARVPGRGYWSYLGTDCSMVARRGAAAQTLNLDGFTVRTAPAEFRRVVRHEFGHALGFPHGQQVQDVVARIDVDKAVAYYMATQGWDRAMALAQFTALSTTEATAFGDSADSVMEYEIPAWLAKDGKVIPGGSDITATDVAAARKFYPGAS